MGNVSTSCIKIDARLREDLGDLSDLMVSIQQYGLLHPIVIDDKRNLIAGQRRLEAFKRLGKKQINVTFYGDLTEDERKILEVEENVRRKDLTTYERSKMTKQLSDDAKEAEAATVSSNVDEKKGRPSKGKASHKAAAERTDLSEAEISRAEAHVAAGEKYPFLQGPLWKQKPALKMAKMLDEIGKKDVEYLYQFCRNGHGSGPKEIRAFFDTWHQASASTMRKLRKRLGGDNSDQTVSLMADCAPNPDAALVWAYGCIREIQSLIKRRTKVDRLLPSLKRIADDIQRFHKEAELHNKKTIEALRKELLS